MAHSGARQNKDRASGTAQCALWVLSVLLLVLGILIGSALSPLHLLSFYSLPTAPTSRGGTTSRRAPDTEVNPSPDDAKNQEDISLPANSVPYHPATVSAQALEVGSRSLTGRLCEQQGCAISLNDVWPVDLLVTRDNRLVTAIRYEKIILVYSETEVDTINVECPLFGLTQLPNGLLAVTCMFDEVILIVDIDAEEHIVRKINTKKVYRLICPSPDNNTLVVAAWMDISIDIITHQGDVIKTLVDSKRLQDIDRFHSMTLHGRDVLACFLSEDFERSSFIRFRLSKSDELDYVDTERLPFTTYAFSVDRAGNMFVNQRDGHVALKSKDGKYRRVIHNPDPEYLGTGIAVYGDRLVAAWRNLRTDTSLLKEYKLFDE